MNEENNKFCKTQWTVFLLKENFITSVFCVAGNNGLDFSRLSHITELDLTENSFSKWSEMLRILDIFPNLTFLNMSKNNFSDRLSLTEAQQGARAQLPLKKLVLNSNKIDWASLSELTKAMPCLEELHLSHNSLKV